MTPKQRSLAKKLAAFRQGRGRDRLVYSPSKPGEYPHKDTGKLWRSITYLLNRRLLTVRVGSNVKYSKYLEEGTKKMAARPFLQRTGLEERTAIRRLVESGEKV